MSATWDPRKAQANFRKHAVRFSDAEAVLMDPNAITRDDPTAQGERRFVSLGLDVVGRGRGGRVRIPRGGRSDDFGSARHSKRETAI